MNQDHYDEWTCEEWICQCGATNIFDFCLECGRRRPEKKNKLVPSEEPPKNFGELEHYESQPKNHFRQPGYDVDVNGNIYRCSSKEEAAYFLKQKNAENFLSSFWMMNNSFNYW